MYYSNEKHMVKVIIKVEVADEVVIEVMATEVLVTDSAVVVGVMIVV